MTDRPSSSLPAALGGGVLVSVAGVLFLMRDHLDWQEWGAPLMVFGAAVGGGLLLSRTLSQDDAQALAVERAGEREDLVQRRDEALAALAALEVQRPTMDPEDYQAERRALLTIGAEAMRELDGAQPQTPTTSPDKGSTQPLAAGVAQLTAALERGEIDAVTFAKAVSALSQANPPSAAAQSAPPAPPAAAAPPAATSAPPAPAKRPSESSSGLSPAWTGAIYTLAAVGIIGTLLYLAQGDAQPRREGAGMTGNQELSSGQSPPASSEAAFLDAAKAKALEALEANPRDIAALNRLTQLSFNEPAQAWNYNQKAREIAPEDPDARVFEAVITGIMGMPEKAHEKFDAVIADHPDHAEAYAYKGLVAMQTKDYAAAVGPLERAQELGLNDPQISNALAIARAGGGSPAPAAASPHAAGGSAVIVSGTVDLDPSRADFSAQVLFVNLRDPSRPGPPFAAVKLPPGPFPMQFKVTEADKIPMMGDQPIPATAVLSLRLDDDGNAFTKADTDPQATVESVQKGTEGVNVTLR